MATIYKDESQLVHSGTPVRSLSYDLSNFAGQAEVHLATVRAEAAQIMSQANQEAARIRQQAEQAGRKAAEDAIERILDEKVAQQMRTLTPALSSAVEQFVDSRNDWLQHWESSVVHLACLIAQRILKRELQSHPEITLDWITQSLRLLGGAGEITIRLHPTDLETLRNQVEKIADVIRPAAPARIVGDPDITSGGCRVETEFGSVDHQLETQLQRISEELS